MNEASQTPAGTGLKRALTLAVIACLALSGWGIVHTRRPISGPARTPAPSSPLKPPPRERATWTLDPDPICLQLRSATRRSVSSHSRSALSASLA